MLGFDEAHLPPGAPRGASYRAYLMGDTDGVPKTPEWAAPITGVPAATLRRLARKDERLGRFDFGALIIRTEHQRRSLERLRQQASDEAFFEPGEGSVVRLTPSPSGRGLG